MPHNTLSVDNVGGPVRYTNFSSVLAKAAIVLGDGFVQIAHQWDLHLAKTAILPRLQAVLHMRELRVNGNPNNLTSDFSELLSLVAEGNNLGGANKGKIKRVEEENQVFACIVGESNIPEITFIP